MMQNGRSLGRALTMSLLLGLPCGLSFGDAGTAVAPDRPAPAPAPNGVAYPAGFMDWRLIGMSHRSDNNTLRAIYGNDIAIQYARSGTNGSWPAGSILVKAVWKDRAHPEWEFAVTPGDFVHVEVMEKDPARFPYSGGWGFGRWLGADAKPYGNDAAFAKECFGCHEVVAHTGYVFTEALRFGATE